MQTVVFYICLTFLFTVAIVSSTIKAIVNGKQGEKGPTGDPGPQGPIGPTGRAG